MNKFYQYILKKSPWEQFEEKNVFTKKTKESFNFNDFQFNFNKKSIFLVGIVAVLLWLSSGIYQIKEGEQAIILRFGGFNRIAMAGLNYHLPRPIENKIVENVNKSRRIEIGYRSSGARNRITSSSSIHDIDTESIMLTGDENIVDLNVDVMWHISDLQKYIFNVLNPKETVKASAESAIREIIGKTPIASVLSNQKQEIADQIETLIQQILNSYNTGVAIEQVQLLKAEPPKEVIQAYRDVQTAKADKEKEINTAEAYNNDVIPKARGAAAKIGQEAEGYKAEVISKAKGDTVRFDKIYGEYRSNKTVMEKRLYLEAVEKILENADKVIMGSNGVLPHMTVGQKN